MYHSSQLVREIIANAICSQDLVEGRGGAQAEADRALTEFKDAVQKAADLEREYKTALETARQLRTQADEASQRWKAYSDAFRMIVIESN